MVSGIAVFCLFVFFVIVAVVVVQCLFVVVLSSCLSVSKLCSLCRFTDRPDITAPVDWA